MGLSGPWMTLQGRSTYYSQAQSSTMSYKQISLGCVKTILLFLQC